VYYNTLPPGLTNPVIRVSPPISGNNTFTSDSGYSFTFQGNGALTLLPAAPANFTLCDPRGVIYARSINLAPTGRAEAAIRVGHQVDGSPVLSCS
jgi:hypothetical protein